MDNLQFSELSNQSCIFHPDKKITFIQVIGVSNQPNANIFLCDQCFDQDLDLKGVNYMTISQIIEKAETELQFKWPPLKDQSLIRMLQLKSQNIVSTDKILDQINSFFAHFKDEIIKKIDYNQKIMINHVQDLPFNKEQIMKKYQQISQILSLRNLLLENQKESFDKHQQKCKDFIYSFETKKESNTKQIEELLKQCDQIEQIIDFGYLNALKQQVLDFVDEIKLNENKDILGQSKSIQSQISDNQQSINDNNNNPEKLMQLISNKSNYCSEEFLESVRKELTKLNKQLSKIQFDNIFKENKQPIKFSQINDEKLQNINEYVENLIKLENDQSYQQQIQQSENLTKIINIFNTKLNFVNENFKKQFANYLVETQVFQNQINFNQLHSDIQKFECLKELNSDQIIVICEIISKQYFDENDLERYSKQFPVFQLLKGNKKDILNEILFEKSEISDGIQRTQIKQNNNKQFEIYLDESNYIGNNKEEQTNCVSQLILQPKKKYIFRFQLQTKDTTAYFLFGLMQNQEKNNQLGYNQNLSCELQFQDEKFQYYDDFGISKFIKGDEFCINKDDMIELRVWQDGKLLQILDYPNKNYKIELRDDMKDNFTELKDLSLYFWLKNDLDKYILREAFIVDEFED
ncbi:hypothetical protein TTHERM_01592580 (macronuclear) [Tetrahymena thermophila SB210]|uniref:Zinc carboxypeptidase family protein n=1 Tax=Tetrahymena thermophila (strain SB210) TaxID=312017 RepID=Q228D1_TETTS|nr:hypothetical protein TTHERM_01592580 [Tetrahymena thermophila SB210]EAR81648.1 hypothetical protein TTHERM_01592580 [Tetrahymena thermophila SB210]|eukprot:XP_001029311.1 hypothetical protein TTHERM_01592580 [Tetrahymena thermophila SB210]